MNLHSFDLVLIFGYLALVAVIGFWVKKKATKQLDSYYLAGRNVPIPYNRTLEAAAVPQVEDIVSAARALAMEGR